MAGRAASQRKVLVLLTGSCKAAVCAVCAYVTALATRPRTVASCTRRRALACSGPFPLRQGMVLWPLQGAASGGPQGANTCDRCVTDVGSLKCTWIHRRAPPAVPAWPCEGVCASLMCRCNAFSSPLRARGWLGAGPRGHLGALRAPVGACLCSRAHCVAPSTEVAGVWEVGGQ